MITAVRLALLLLALVPLPPPMLLLFLLLLALRLLLALLLPLPLKRPLLMRVVGNRCRACIWVGQASWRGLRLVERGSRSSRSKAPENRASLALWSVLVGVVVTEEEVEAGVEVVEEEEEEEEEE